MNPLTLLVDALTFRTATFVALKKSPHVFAHGLLLLILISLLVGLVREGLGEFAYLSETPDVRSSRALAAVDSSFANFPGNEQMRRLIQGSVREGVQMGFAIAALPPRGGPAVRPIDRALTFLGSWLSTPFQPGWLPFLFFAAVLLHPAARLLGGRGSLPQLLGLSALAFAPDVLNPLQLILNTIDRLTPIVGVGPLAGLVGFIVVAWETAIYVKAVSVAEELSLGRSAATILVAILLGLAVLLILGLLIAAAVALGLAFRR